MKTALVIGASRGIGQEFTRQLLAQGWKVFATARKKEDLAKLLEMGATPIQLDVSSALSIAGLAWQLDAVRLDLAIYAAGVFGPRHHANVAPTEEEFDQVMHTNVRGAMQLIPTVAPLVAVGTGKFVFLSSHLSSINTAASSGGWLYRVSKAALNMAVKSAAIDYPGATMLMLSPGQSVRTDMGGADAKLAIDESVSGMLQVITTLESSPCSSFRDYAGGVLPW